MRLPPLDPGLNAIPATAAVDLSFAVRADADGAEPPVATFRDVGINVVEPEHHAAAFAYDRHEPGANLESGSVTVSVPLVEQSWNEVIVHYSIDGAIEELAEPVAEFAGGNVLRGTWVASTRRAPGEVGNHSRIAVFPAAGELRALCFGPFVRQWANESEPFATVQFRSLDALPYDGEWLDLPEPVSTGDPRLVGQVSFGQNQYGKRWVSLELPGVMLHGMDAATILGSDGDPLHVVAVIPQYSKDEEGNVGPGRTIVSANFDDRSEIDSVTVVLNNRADIIHGEWEIELPNSREPGDNKKGAFE